MTFSDFARELSQASLEVVRLGVIVENEKKKSHPAVQCVFLFHAAPSSIEGSFCSTSIALVSTVLVKFLEIGFMWEGGVALLATRLHLERDAVIYTLVKVGSIRVLAVAHPGC